MQVKKWRMTQNKEVPILILFLAKIYTFLTIFHYKKNFNTPKLRKNHPQKQNNNNNT